MKKLMGAFLYIVCFFVLFTVIYRLAFCEPVLPGVYSVECMAQTADILLLSAERYAGKIPLFLGINNVRFLKKILPGDTIEIHAKMASERVEKAIATCSAEVYNHGELAVTGDVTLAMR